MPRKRLYLTLDSNVVKALKRKRINISRYIERLVHRDFVSADDNREVRSSNLRGPTFLN